MSIQLSRTNSDVGGLSPPNLPKLQLCDNPANKKEEPEKHQEDAAEIQNEPATQEEAEEMDTDQQPPEIEKEDVAQEAMQEEEEKAEIQEEAEEVETEEQANDDENETQKFNKELPVQKSILKPSAKRGKPTKKPAKHVNISCVVTKGPAKKGAERYFGL